MKISRGGQFIYPATRNTLYSAGAEFALPDARLLVPVASNAINNLCIFCAMINIAHARSCSFVRNHGVPLTQNEPSDGTGR